MKNLYLTVEGQTEEDFAVKLLQAHLAPFSVFLWPPRFTGAHGRRRGRIPRGGMFHTFRHALEDMRRWMKEIRSSDARFSMMMDLYHLPRVFPGYDEGMAQADCHQQAAVMERAIHAELNDPRFTPYLQVHEFEALVLAQPERFAELFEDRQHVVAELCAECAPYSTPERINHGPDSHPKKRIEKHFHDYDENVHGPLLAYAIGLNVLRVRCPHFGQWLARLEQLDQGGSTASA